MKMSKKLGRLAVLGVLIIGVVLISGCVQEKAPTLPKKTVTEPPQTETATAQPPATTYLPTTTPPASETPKIISWTMAGLLKDWLITPMDLVITGEEIYVSGNLDRRIAVLNLKGQILRYYTLEKNPGFENICVGVTSQGQVFAVSSKGLWELKPDGEAKEVISFGFSIRYIDHMTIGPDDGIYVSHKPYGKSVISRIGLDGTITDVLAISSNRISDLDFDSNGNLFMFDGEHGQILKYSQGQGVKIFASGFGRGAMYLTFDEEGRLYTTSHKYRLALVSADGEVTPLKFHATGDLVFHNRSLYTTDIYTSTLYQLRIRHTAVLKKRVLLEGNVPWYIDHQDDVIVGQRWAFRGRKFYNYHLNDNVRIEPNHMLNKLQPDQYTFDDVGNMYLLFGDDVLKKITPAGKEKFSIVRPGRFRHDSPLHYDPSGDKIYHFDADSNSVIRASRRRTEIYHKFSSEAKEVFLAITPQGKIYAAVISSSGAELIDISNPPAEKVVWKLYKELSWFHIASDAEGNLYAALGPAFQRVFLIDPSEGKIIPIVPQSPSRYDMEFIDPQGFTVTESGTVVLSAPGVLVEFSQR